MYEQLLDLSEVCFCGRYGPLVERVPVYIADGEWGLECPECGHLDQFLSLAPLARRQLLRQAARHWEGRDARRAPRHRQAS
jgi:hypothetical protein